MRRKSISAAVSTALCLAPVAPGAALAQEHRFSGFEGPRGATATINLRVPLGRENSGRASYGLTFGYGQTVAAGLDGRTSSRMMNLADLRFSQRGELRNARLAGFDLAHPDRDRRLNLLGGLDGKSAWAAGAVLIVIAVAACAAAGCFDGGDDDDVSPGGPYQGP